MDEAGNDGVERGEGVELEDGVEGPTFGERHGDDGQPGRAPRTPPLEEAGIKCSLELSSELDKALHSSSSLNGRYTGESSHELDTQFDKQY